MKYIYNIYKNNFKQFGTVKSFGDNFQADKIAINKAERDEINLLENMVEFNYKSRPRSKEGQERNEILMKN